MRPYRGRMISGLTFGILVAATNGLLMLAVGLVLNLVFAGNADAAKELSESIPKMLRPAWEFLQTRLAHLAGTEVNKAALVIGVMAIPAMMTIRGICSYLNIYLMNWSAVRAIADLRAAVFENLQNLSLKFFSTARTGELIARTTGDTDTLRQTLVSSIPSLVRDPANVLVLVGVLLSKQPALTMVSVIVFPLCVIPIMIYGKKVRQAARAAQTHSAELSSLMHETFTAIRIVKAYNLEARMTQLFRATTGKTIGQIMRIIRAHEVPSQLMEILGAFGVALVILYVGLFKSGGMRPGDFFQFIISIFMMYQPIKSLSKVATQLQAAQAATQRVFELLHTKPTVVEPASPVSLTAKGQPIHFAGVNFRYEEKPVLCDIELTVNPGEQVALVGASGSGKTTLTNLLLRFYDPESGAIKIGGADIRSVSLANLRRNIAVVTQETILFNESVRSNIACGRPEATLAEVEQAARQAFAHEFISQMPQGYDTVVGEKGVMLSGGQRQRLSIARAILKDAPILILDEATNALDTESERIVQGALEELMKGRTTFVIAHRLSTVQNATVIVVMDQGCIVERGTHAELLARDGVYRKLHELQFRA